MHYRNGREAKNGDKIIQLGMSGDAAGQIQNVGILFNATPGNDYYNGQIAPTSTSVVGACICDCLHVDDLAALLWEVRWCRCRCGKKDHAIKAQHQESDF